MDNLSNQELDNLRNHKNNVTKISTSSYYRTYNANLLHDLEKDLIILVKLRNVYKIPISYLIQSKSIKQISIIIKNI